MTAHAPDRARPMSTRRTIFVLGPLSIFGPLSMDMYLPALPQLARELSASDAQAQVTMSACMMGLGIGQLIAGPLSDRFGRRRPLIVGVALFALLSVACALAPSIEMLIALRLVQGMAGAAGMVVSMATARDMFHGAELSRLMSLLALVSFMGPTLAPVIGGQLVRVMDWRGIFGVLGGIGALLLVVAITSLRETLPPERRHADHCASTGSRFREVVRDRQFRLLLLVASVTSTGFFAYLSMTSFIFQQQFSISPTAFSLVFALNSVAMLAGSQLSGFLVRRTGPARMYLAALVISLVGAVALTGTALAGATFVVFAAVLCATMFTTGLSGPNSSTLALEHHGSRAGTASSIYGVASFGVGPVVVPVISLLGATALTLAATMLVTAVIACAISWTVLRRELLRNAR